MKRLRLLMASLLLAPLGCPESGAGVPEPVIPKVSGSEWCDKAEANLVSLECEEGKPTSEGKRFADVCRETQANGIDLNPQCLAGVKSCGAIDKECAWHR